MGKVRTRFAPSPTGYVHIGSIHNALFAHALAKHHNGEFILRIEDTDQKRYVEGAVDALYEMLYEFEIIPDEGPKEGGPHKPYVQSERLTDGIYKEAAEKLIEKGMAYYCFLTSEELAEMKGGLVDKRKRNQAFRSPYRDLSIEEARRRIQDGDSYVIRLKVPENEEISIDDAILGKVSWNTNEVDDQVLIKSDGFPTYQLGVVVDDHAMGITHVTRAYEWLPSTPKQILIYRALGWEMPVFAHSSLILDPDGGKLSKRKGNVSAKQFIIEGYLTDALKNFLMLLGWSAPIERSHGEKEREIFSHEEFIEMYRLEDRHKHNAIFDRDKLLWFNQQYIKMKDSKELAEIFTNWFEKYYDPSAELSPEPSPPPADRQGDSDDPSFDSAQDDTELIKAVLSDGGLVEKLALVQERAKTLVEVLEMIKFFYEAPENIEWDIKQTKKYVEKIPEIREKIKGVLEAYPQNATERDQQKWVDDMKKISDEFGIKGGDSFMVLRLAVCGSPFSPPLFEALQILGKEEVVERVRKSN